MDRVVVVTFKLGSDQRPPVRAWGPYDQVSCHGYRGQVWYLTYPDGLFHYPAENDNG